MDMNQLHTNETPEQNAPSPVNAQSEMPQPETAQSETPDNRAPQTTAPNAAAAGANPGYGQENGTNGYTQTPYGNTGYTPQANAQNPQYNTGAYTQNPYGNSTYAANGYNQNPLYTANGTAQNPYQNSGYTGGAYGQNPYYSPHYGQAPFHPPQFNPYAVPYGRTNPAYAQSPVGRPVANDPQTLLQRQRASRDIKVLSRAHGLAVLGFSVIAFIISLIVFMIPGFADAYQNNTFFETAVDALLAITVIFVPFALVGRYLKKQNVLKGLPLGTAYQPAASVLLVFAGLACCIAGSYASSIFDSIVESFFGITFTMPSDETVIDSVPMFLMTVLGTAVIPALVEEFAIRGVVMQSLRKYGDKFAIVMSAFVFALMHGNMVQIPFAFIAGIAIGYAVVVTGTMWTGVAIHFLNNFVSVLMQTAVDNLSDDNSTFVILGIITAIFVIGGICAIVYAKRYLRTATLSKGEALLPTAEKNKAYLCTVPMVLAILLLVVQTARYVEF